MVRKRGADQYSNYTHRAGVLEIPLHQVVADPSQPRRDWGSVAAQQALSALVESIREFGVLQPLLVRHDAEASEDAPRYIVIAGGRRREAAALAGLAVVPVVLYDTDNMRVRMLQLTENLLRQDLTPLDEARAYRELMDLESISAEELGRRLHISGQTVRNRLRILDDQLITDAIARGQIALSAGHLLLQLPEEERQQFLVRIRAGEKVLTPGVIRSRRARLEAGIVHPDRHRVGRSSAKEPSNVKGTEESPDLDTGTQVMPPLNTHTFVTAYPTETSPKDGAVHLTSPSKKETLAVTICTPADYLSNPQEERARVLADILAAVLWRGLRDTEAAEAMAGLREVLASPGAGLWSSTLLTEVVRRLERSRY